MENLSGLDAIDRRILQALQAQGRATYDELAQAVGLSPSATLRRALWRYPAMTFAVVARIHWQALRLLAKRVPFVRKPAAPEVFVTR